MKVKGAEEQVINILGYDKATYVFILKCVTSMYGMAWRGVPYGLFFRRL